MPPHVQVSSRCKVRKLVDLSSNLDTWIAKGVPKQYPLFIRHNSTKENN